MLLFFVKLVPYFLICYIHLATQESGFVHAIVSAGTMHAMSRACMESKLSSYCACSEEGRPEDLDSQHVWAGCGDNLPYGFRFSKQFMDASEVINENSLESFEKALMNLHNNEVGRWVRMNIKLHS